jgi:hypothetical protein
VQQPLGTRMLTLRSSLGAAIAVAGCVVRSSARYVGDVVGERFRVRFPAPAAATATVLYTSAACCSSSRSVGERRARSDEAPAVALGPAAHQRGGKRAAADQTARIVEHAQRARAGTAGRHMHARAGGVKSRRRVRTGEGCLVGSYERAVLGGY